MANIGGNYFRPAPIYESRASGKSAKSRKWHGET
ncbi:hypothetical protein SSPS47_06505 [Streptomyces sp. S4.7]|nr:hypothetical protein SSPS47_06505 [Streptomyces sp. S4.7]